MHLWDCIKGKSNVCGPVWFKLVLFKGRLCYWRISPFTSAWGAGCSLHHHSQIVGVYFMTSAWPPPFYMSPSLLEILCPKWDFELVSKLWSCKLLLNYMPGTFIKNLSPYKCWSQHQNFGAYSFYLLLNEFS